jgi:hypothetical protein
MQAQGFDVTHVYGLTETYGPAVICSWDPDWNDLPLPEQAQIRFDKFDHPLTEIAFDALMDWIRIRISFTSLRLAPIKSNQIKSSNHGT